MVRSPLILAVMMSVLMVQPAQADIIVSFYAHDFGRNFPHAFLRAKGSWDKDGKTVDDTFGFTAKHVSPALLVGPVPGDFEPVTKHALTISKRRFSVVASDAQYTALLAVVGNWRKNPAANYDLDRRNCVYFVGEAAQALGLKVTFPKPLMKSPSKYLLHIGKLNPQLSAIEAGGKRRQKQQMRKAPITRTSEPEPAKTGSLY
jgi:hypothetical protein